MSDKVSTAVDPKKPTITIHGMHLRASIAWNLKVDIGLFFFTTLNTCAMGRKALVTQDASCGPDDTEWNSWQWNHWSYEETPVNDNWYQWPHWHWGDHQDAGTATSFVDLQTSEEKQQHEDDEAYYITDYYQKKAARRKRHAENRKEHVWQAQERLAMSQNDYQADRVDQGVQGQTSPTVVNIKASMPPVGGNSTATQVDPAWPSTDGKPLASAFLAVAANLDLDDSCTKRRIDNPSSSSGLHRFQVLEHPYLDFKELQPPIDLVPHQPVMKSFPQPRTAGYNRLIPKLNGRCNGTNHVINPPYGIQLIENFRRWRMTYGR